MILTVAICSNKIIRGPECLQDIENWLRHYVKFNVDKTELLEICPYYHQKVHQ